MNKIKILLIGDLMVDHYIIGSCSRISPEAPVPVVEIQKELDALGGAGNVLKNLLSFDCDVHIISVIGNDDGCGIVLSHLEKLGVSPDGLIKDYNRHTSIKSRVMAGNHQLLRIDKESVEPITESQEDLLLEKLDSIIDNYTVLLFSDYNKGLLTKDFLVKAIRLCKTKGIKTLVDPKGKDFSKYFGINLIKPNKKEASIATGIDIKDNQTLLQACKALKQITNCESIVITLSEQGIAVYENEELYISPTKALEVIDVTGAGDTVLASLGWALASGHTLKQASDFANKAASIVVSKVGSATASFEEIKNRFGTI